MTFQSGPIQTQVGLAHFVLFRLGPLVGNTIDDFLPRRFSTFLLLLDFLLAGLAPSTSMAAADCQ